MCLQISREITVVKVIVKLSLRVIHEAAGHEDVLERRDVTLPLLTSTLDGGEWSVSPPRKEPLVPTG
jgi:hypothetical protein